MRQSEAVLEQLGNSKRGHTQDLIGTIIDGKYEVLSLEAKVNGDCLSGKEYSFGQHSCHEGSSPSPALLECLDRFRQEAQSARLRKGDRFIESNMIRVLYVALDATGKKEEAKAAREEHKQWLKSKD